MNSSIKKIRMLQRKQMLQQAVFINKIRMLQRTMLQRAVFINKIRVLQRTQMPQRRVFINKTRMLQRTMLQRKVFINKTRMLQRTMLQRRVFINKTRMLQAGGGILFFIESSIIFFTRERVFMLFTCVRVLSFLLRKVSSYISLRKDRLCFSNLHVQCIKVKLINFTLFLHEIFYFVLHFSCLNGCVGR
jgi:hypothetical protein